MPVFANTFLFSFKQARICNDLVILFLRPAVSRPHTAKPTQRTPDLQAQEECLERWGTVCHKCSLGCSRSSSYQKYQMLRGDDLPPPTCTIVLGNWLPVPEYMFCDILWALQEFGSLVLIAFFSDFLYQICYRFSFYIVFQNLFEYLYNFSIALCFSVSIIYSNTITFWFSISFSYRH